MAAGKFNMQKASGGVASITVADGVSNTAVVLPESGTVASVDTAVTDNAIARYDSTTGKLQNSAITIDDSGNIGSGTQSFNGFGGSGFKNYIINGNFDVWQRGNGYSITTVSNTYTSDRFYATLNQVSSGTLFVAQNVVHKEVGNNYCLELNAQTLVTTVGLSITQIIESFVAKRLAGKTVTLSVRAKVLSGTSNCSIVIKEGTNIDSYPNGATFNSNVNITTSYQTFIMQATISQATTSLLFRINTPSAFNGVLYIQNVQLEEGSVATPFENRPYGLELSLCQRYYEKSFVSSPTELGGLIWNNGQVDLTLVVGTKFSVEKRIPPQLTIYAGNSNGTNNAVNTGTGVKTVTSCIDIGTKGFGRIYIYATSSSTWQSYHYEAMAEL